MTKFSPAECLEQLTNIDFIARALCAGFGASVAFQMETDTIVVPKSAKTKGGWTKLLCKSIGTSKGTGCLILLTLEISWRQWSFIVKLKMESQNYGS